MPADDIPLALPCQFAFGRRDGGHLAPVDGSSAEWSGRHAAVIRQTDTADEMSPLLVALVAHNARPLPFHADYDAGIVSTPLGDQEASEFRNSHFRCDREGNLVGTFLDPAWMQMRDARAADSAPHIADVERFLAARRRGATVADEVDWRLFDIVMSAQSDGLSAEDALARSRVRPDAPVHVLHGLEGLVSMRIDENGVLAPDLILEGWREIREYPQYLIAGVRAMFGHFISDLIGDTPIEEIVRLQQPRGYVEDICEVFLQEGFDDLGTSPPFADDKVMQRGYATSEVRNFSGNGCRVIVFEDFSGSYIYAWPQAARRNLDVRSGASL